MDPLRDPGPPPRPSLISRARHWLRPPRVLRPTRAGWVFFAIIFGVGFAALNTGNNLLYLVLSLMLSFLALSGVMSESALRGITVRRRLPRELYAQRENSVLLEIANQQRRVPAFAIVVEDVLRLARDGTRQTRGGSHGRKRKTAEPAGRCFTLRIGPGEVETRRYRFQPLRRGHVTFSGFRVSTRFPFGLFLKSREITAPAQALIFPEVTPSRCRPTPRKARDSGSAANLARSQGGTVAGLREFEDGDSMRRVHWRSSLRRSVLMVSETEDDVDLEVEVVLSASRDRGGAPTGDRFERRVSRAASEVVEHLQRGLAVALRTDAIYLPAETGPRHRIRLLSFLALVRADGSAEAEASS